MLALVALTLALRPVPGPATDQAVVARVDVAGGTALGPVEVEARRVDVAMLPVGALTDPAEAVGRRPVGPVRAGEAVS